MCYVSSIPLHVWENKMTQTSSKTYKFIRIPEADCTWMHTNTANATCCVTQVITVKQACPTCNIQTPFGEINTTLFNSNFAYIGGTTIVWEAKPPEPKKCEYVKIHKGTGNLRSHVYTGRLSDQLYQLEYIFDFKQAHIPCPEITLNFTDIHLVQRISETFIAFNNHSKFKTNKTNCLGLEENIPAYLAMNNAVVKTFNHTYYFASSGGMQKKIREK